MRRPKTSQDHLARLDAVAAKLALVEKSPAPNLTAISGLALEIGLRALEAHLSPAGADRSLTRLVRAARSTAEPVPGPVPTRPRRKGPARG